MYGQLKAHSQIFRQYYDVFYQVLGLPLGIQMLLYFQLQGGYAPPP